MYTQKPSRWFYLNSLLLFVLFTITSNSHAAESLIVPEVCAERAAEINIFDLKGEPQEILKETKLKLRDAKVGNQKINFQAISSAYKNTLAEINTQLKTYDSPLFRYLVNCKNNSRECHGYFNIVVEKYKNQISKKPNLLPVFLGTNEDTAPFLKAPPILNQYSYPTPFSPKENVYKTPEQIALQKQEDLRRNIFCDGQIYRLTATKSLEAREKKFNQCVEKPQEIKIDSSVSLDPKILRSCYYEIVRDGKLLLKNRSSKMLSELDYISSMSDKSGDISLAAINASFLPEGFLFILRKAFEEFKETEVTLKHKKDELDQFYNRVDLGFELSKCCSNTNLKFSEQQNSAEKIREEGSSILRHLRASDGVDVHNLSPSDDVNIFIPKDPYTKIVFAEAERQHWVNRFKDGKGLYLNPTEKIAYYSYLNKNPFFLADQTSTFDDFVKDPQLYKKHLTTLDKEPNSEVMKKFQRQLGLSKFESFELTGNHNEKQPGTTPQFKDPKFKKILDDDRERRKESKTQQQFVFDEAFRAAYSSKLIKDKKDADYLSLENQNQKVDYYSRMFKSVLHYQFQRVTQARVLREMQKRTYDSLKHEKPFEKDKPRPLDDNVTFHKWVEDLMCKGMEKTFCSDQYKDFRTRKHEELYKKIDSGGFDLSYVEDPNVSTRTYVYDQAFLDTVNEKIKTINQYCYDNVNPEDYKKNPEYYRIAMNRFLDEFYSIRGVPHIASQTDFVGTLEFEVGHEAEKCFTRGFLFGKSGYLSKEATQRVADVARQGGVPADPASLVSDMPIHKAYVPSLFQLKLSQIHDLEEDIEDLIETELVTLKENFHFDNLGNFETFLEESAATRIFALLDYALENPSDKIAKYICHLIEKSDRDKFKHQQNVEMYLTSMSVAAMVLPFVVPLVVRGALVAYRAGTALAITVVGVGSAGYNLYHYSKNNDALDIAAITENMKYNDVQLIHSVYNKKTAEARTTMMIDIGLMVVFSGKAIYQSRVYWKKLLNGSFQATRKTRLIDLSELERNSAGEIRTQLGKEIEEFVLDSTKVSDEQFMLLKEQLALGAVATENFLLQTWGSELGKLVEKEILVRRLDELKKIVENPQSVASLSYNKDVLNFLGSAQVNEADWQAFKKAFELGKESSDNFLETRWGNELKEILHPEKGELRRVYDAVAQSNIVQVPANFITQKALVTKYYLTRKLSYPMKSWIVEILESKGWYEIFPYKQLKNEVRIIKMIETGKKLQMIKDEEIRQFASKMKFFSLNSKGKFIRVLDEEMEDAYARFFSRSVRGDTQAIGEYLKPLVGSTLLKNEWITILNNFNGKITSIDDCKSFLKVLKYAEKQYSTLAEQVKNMKEILNWHELFGTYVYQQRTKIILERINTFYEIAQYTRYKNDIRMIQNFGKFFKRGVINEEKFEMAIRDQKIDPDFNYTNKLLNLNKSLAEVEKFEAKYPQFFEALAGSDDMYKYEKEFLKQEKKYNDLFHKKINKYSVKNDPVQTYKRALKEVQEEKMVAFECSLPNSLHRRNITRLYRKWAGYTAFATGVMGYYGAHSNDEKNGEWWGRFLYEVSVSLLGGYVQSRIFTTKDGAPLYKVSHDLASGSLITLMDATIYKAASSVFWSQEDKYKNEFARIIYESENVRQTVTEFFKAHPEIESKILAQLQKVESVMNEVNIKLGKGTLVNDDIENEFIKAGLIDNIFNFDGSLNEKELSKDYVYHDMIENGYIDPELYKNHTTDEELRDQIYGLLRNIVYNDAYENKSREIKYPLLPAVNVGNIDWLEIRTGDEALDRMIFYPLVYDLPKTPLAYAKNHFVYDLMCKGYWKMPGNTEQYAAIAINAAYKAIVDPLKYYLREQATGR